MLFTESFSLKNFIVVGSKFFYAFSYFIFLIILQNNANLTEFENFAKYMSVVGFISLIAHYGQSKSLLHEFKENINDYDQLGNKVSESLNLISILVVFTFPIVLLLNESLAISSLLISFLSAISIMNYISQYFLNFLFAKLRLNILFSLLIFFLSPLVSIASLLFFIYVSKLDLELYLIIVAFELIRSVINILLYFYLFKKLRIIKNYSFRLPQIKESFLISISDILANSAKHFYIIFLSYYATSEDIAFLYIVLRFCELIILPAKALLNRYIPDISELFFRNNIGEMNKKIFEQIVLLSSGILAMLAILGFMYQYIFNLFSIQQSYLDVFIIFIIAAAISSIFYYQETLLILEKRYSSLIFFITLEILLFMVMCIISYEIFGLVGIGIFYLIFKLIKHAYLLILQNNYNFLNG